MSTKPSAVLFDLDNCLVDSERLWPDIDAAYFTSLIGHEQWKAWRPDWLAMRAKHIQLDVMLQMLRERYSVTTSVPDIKQAREDAMFDYYRQHLKEYPYATRFLESLNRIRIPVAIASGMSPRIIRFVVELMRWSGLVQAIASTHETGKSKPDPSVFLLAAKRLNVPPAQCVVVENELFGYWAARAADMECYVVPDSDARRQKCLEAGATVHASLEEVMRHMGF